MFAIAWLSCFKPNTQPSRRVGVGGVYRVGLLYRTLHTNGRRRTRLGPISIFFKDDINKKKYTLYKSDQSFVISYREVFRFCKSVLHVMKIPHVYLHSADSRKETFTHTPNIVFTYSLYTTHVTCINCTNSDKSTNRKLEVIGRWRRWRHRGWRRKSLIEVGAMHLCCAACNGVSSGVYVTRGDRFRVPC